MDTKSSLRIPISNVYGGGDYTAQILIGSQKDPANVILDTGSSTLAVKPKAYDASQDKDLEATAYAQDVTYGTGGWAGPVIKSTVELKGTAHSVSLPSTHLAITSNAQPHNFGQADGILGLAYHSLNNAYDLGDYLSQHDVKPPVTYPWPFSGLQNTTAAIRQFQGQLRSFPEQDIEPYFTNLEQQGYVANKFAFYTLRSSVNVTSKTETYAAALHDPLNQGFFVLGGGEEQTNLYSGDFQTIKVVSDAYYNTNLKYIQVGSGAQITAAALQPNFVPYAYSNSIVDSGTNSIALTYHLYNGILDALYSLNPSFVHLINQFNQDMNSGTGGLPMSQLNLEEWPDIHFVMEGVKGQDVVLTCTPDTYWQTNSPAPGQAFFKISGGPNNSNQPNQSILGLPLMNNYYCIFDRSMDTQGVIKFAQIEKNLG